VPKHFPHFVRIDQDGRRTRARHYVVHLGEPTFTVELTMDAAASGPVEGVIKRVCVPNSWAGDYTKYAKLLTKAQEFFAQTE
jgi:hypothetical protein